MKESSILEIMKAEMQKFNEPGQRAVMRKYDRLFDGISELLDDLMKEQFILAYRIGYRHGKGEMKDRLESLSYRKNKAAQKNL